MGVVVDTGATIFETDDESILTFIQCSISVMITINDGTRRPEMFSSEINCVALWRCLCVI